MPAPDTTPAAGHELLEHTADVGLRAWGPTPAAAFAEAARGMLALMGCGDSQDKPHTEEQTTVEIEVAGSDWPELLVNWLAELLYLFQAEGFVPSTISFSACAPPSCRAQLLGRHLAASEGAAGLAIKGVTYHQLQVTAGADRTEIRVIFDI